MAADNTTNPLVKSAVLANAAFSANTVAVIAAGAVKTGALDVGLVACSNQQVGRMYFCGVGADNGTFNVAIWARTEVANSAGVGDTAYMVDYLGTAVVILSTATGVAGSTNLPTTVRFADTITWTPSSTGTTITGGYTALCGELGYNTGVAYSPANNTPGYLFLPCLGGGSELLFDYSGGADITKNVLCQVNTIT